MGSSFSRATVLVAIFVGVFVLAGCKTPRTVTITFEPLVRVA